MRPAALSDHSPLTTHHSLRPSPRPVVLTFLDYYLPGVKAGGPVKTVRTMVARLGDQLDFRIVTRDRDLGDGAAYAGLRPGAWHRVEGADVLYVPPAQSLRAALRDGLRGTGFDALYFNSFFSPRFSLAPLMLARLGLIPRRPVIVAPRGELLAGTLRLKAWKKRPFVWMTRRLGLYRDVLWQASSELEADDIRRAFGAAARIIVAPNLVPAAVCEAPERSPKQPGRLEVAFLSRICPKKNLRGAIRMLHGLRGDVRFSIYGPTEDAAYWRECQAALAELPPNVRAEYRGIVPPDRVTATLAGHDLLLLPTFGENFGHVILEALHAGCPVLISDRTPWRDLQTQRAGWESPPEAVESFRGTLQRAADMDETEHHRLRTGARELAAAVCRDEAAVERNRRLFEIALSGCRMTKSE